MEYTNKRIILTEDGNGNVTEKQNHITYEGATLFLKYLNPQYKSSKGGNSSVFILYDKNGDCDERIIKICNYHKPNRSTPDDIKRRYGRFINEINVLEKFKEEKAKNIVTLYFNDVPQDIDPKKFSRIIDHIKKVKAGLNQDVDKNNFKIN